MIKELYRLFLPNSFNKNLERLSDVRSKKIQAQLLRIVIIGHQVLDNAEYAIERINQLDQRNDEESGISVPPELTEVLCEQGYLLDRLCLLLENFSSEMDIYDRDLKKSLQWFADGKAPLFFEASLSLKQGIFPLPWYEDPIFYQGIDFSDSLVNDKFQHTKTAKVKGEIREFYHIHYTLSSELSCQIRRYIEHEDPLNKIRQLRAALDRYLETLKQDFTIKEILPYLHG